MLTHVDYCRALAVNRIHEKLLLSKRLKQAQTRTCHTKVSTFAPPRPTPPARSRTLPSRAQIAIDMVRGVNDGSSLTISSVTDDEARTMRGGAGDVSARPARAPAASEEEDLARSTRSRARASIWSRETAVTARPAALHRSLALNTGGAASGGRWQPDRSRRSEGCLASVPGSAPLAARCSPPDDSAVGARGAFAGCRRRSPKRDAMDEDRDEYP